MVEMPISAPSGCLQEDEVDCVYLERQKKKKKSLTAACLFL